MRPSDTSAEAWKVFIDLQRRQSPSEKLHRTLAYSEFIRKASEAGMRRRYPNADKRELWLRIARRNLGDDLFRKVYGDTIRDDPRSTE